MTQALLLDVEPTPEPSTDERYTPTALFQRLTRGALLELDVSATSESTKCPRFFDMEANGLKQPWDRPAWCNPPWSNIEPWMRKANYEIHTGRCPLLYMLLPAWTDRAWWHDAVEPFRDGRVPAPGLTSVITTHFQRRERFGSPGDPEGLKAGSPNFWTVLLIWRRP